MCSSSLDSGPALLLGFTWPLPCHFFMHVVTQGLPVLNMCRQPEGSWKLRKDVVEDTRNMSRAWPGREEKGIPGEAVVIMAPGTSSASKTRGTKKGEHHFGRVMIPWVPVSILPSSLGGVHLCSVTCEVKIHLPDFCCGVVLAHAKVSPVLMVVMCLARQRHWCQ